MDFINFLASTNIAGVGQLVATGINGRAQELASETTTTIIVVGGLAVIIATVVVFLTSGFSWKKTLMTFFLGGFVLWGIAGGYDWLQGVVGEEIEAAPAPPAVVQYDQHQA